MKIIGNISYGKLINLVRWWIYASRLSSRDRITVTFVNISVSCTPGFPGPNLSLWIILRQLNNWHGQMSVSNLYRLFVISPCIRIVLIWKRTHGYGFQFVCVNIVSNNLLHNAHTLIINRFKFFAAFGCPDPLPPDNGYVERKDDLATIGCLGFDDVTWEIICRNGEWIGEFGDCLIGQIYDSIQILIFIGCIYVINFKQFQQKLFPIAMCFTSLLTMLSKEYPLYMQQICWQALEASTSVHFISIFFVFCLVFDYDWHIPQ